MLQYQTSHQKSKGQTTGRNPLELGTPSKASCTHERLIQLGKPPCPIHCDEEEKAAKVKTKNTDENTVM